MSDVGQELRRFIAGPWGLATADPAHARGLCKRAILALLAQLEGLALSAPSNSGGWKVVDQTPSAKEIIGCLFAAKTSLT